jgi:hypothetical protein
MWDRQICFRLTLLVILIYYLVLFRGWFSGLFKGIFSTYHATTVDVFFILEFHLLIISNRCIFTVFSQRSNGLLILNPVEGFTMIAFGVDLRLEKQRLWRNGFCDANRVLGIGMQMI